MKIGILTFYCSDNYGAMLQACGLKYYVQSVCPETEIIPYAPAYLTGRHWLLPYCPFESLPKILRHGAAGLKRNLKTGRAFFRRRKNMKSFRQTYLIRKRKTIRTLRGLEKTSYDIYLTGSDQIWNPDITFGLRRAYFGAFRTGRPKRVIAYAASLGKSCLAPGYEEEMRALLRSVDSISLREKTAVPYLRKLTGKDVFAVSDPVFLLNAEKWQRFETPPEGKNYILVYDTENNEELHRYARKLSAGKALPAVELIPGGMSGKMPFPVDDCAGPAEFLGYIHHAAYVVTNSFHAAAFCIIFHRPFLAFAHSTANARLADLLAACGLQERLVSTGRTPADIDQPVLWQEADERKDRLAERSRRFLIRAITGSQEGGNGFGQKNFYGGTGLHRDAGVQHSGISSGLSGVHPAADLWEAGADPGGRRV